MGNRNHVFALDEYYHCFNRGTDKRIIFDDLQDYAYFIRSLEAYNDSIILGKLRLYKNKPPKQPLVEIVSYCLLPNHFHLVLKQVTENGISNFMKRIGVGYTMYFNEKNKRSGSLFQGVFKSKHLETDQDLKQVLSYVFHNNIIHSILNKDKYKNYLNEQSSIVQSYGSSKLGSSNMLEIAEIIKEQRLSFD